MPTREEVLEALESGRAYSSLSLSSGGGDGDDELDPLESIGTEEHQYEVSEDRAVLAPGTILTGGTVVYDLVNDEFYRKTADAPLEIPAGAVVVPGTRAITKGRGPEFGLAIYTPIIVKYRDEKTDASVRLEDFLR